MKKNLDKLFQEKLNDLHDLPSDNVWKSIEASLDKNKKTRRILPLWWTLGGVAALLAILFYVTQPNTLEFDANSIITDTEKKNLTTPSTIDEGQNRVLKSEDETLINIEAPQKNQKNNKGNNEEIQQNKGAWAVTSTENPNPSKTNKRYSKTAINPITYNEKENTITSTAKSEQSIAVNKTVNGNALANSKNLSNKDNIKDVGHDNTAVNQLFSPNALSSEVAETLNQETKTEKTTGVKKSIYDEISPENNTEEITASVSKKWSLEPSIAPVYFNGFGSGSPIHPEFVSNSKSGNVNLSYGVFVSYEVSKKLSVRSGVHKVDYGYDTNDVNFTSSFASTTNSNLTNIDYSSNASNVIVVSASKGKSSLNTQAEVSGKTPSKNGSMVQQFGYLEIPLELNYALLDKDFGINLIGGFSSLFLTNNAVLLEANGLNTEIGEANNINDVNFSSNIGFGFNYKFTPKIKLNIEPVFKYQLNTFSNSAGDFKPFTVGVYSGFNFKF